MNSKLKIAGLIWVFGFVVGVVLVGRWRRTGKAQVETSPEPVSTGAPAPAPSKVKSAANRVAGPVVAGAKADLVTVRNATKKVGNRVTSPFAKADAATLN